MSIPAQLQGDWLRCYRLAHRSHFLEARRSPGGEPYGQDDFELTTEPGQWLCRNPENGYRWVCSDADFVRLYCEVGKTPPKTTGKGKQGQRAAKGSSLSHEASGRKS